MSHLEPLVPFSARIRLERADDPVDISAVRDILVAAFATDAEAKLVDALRAAGDYQAGWSLLAEVDDVVVGQCLLTAATLERADGSLVRGRVLALGPIAVAPAWQRRGIGTKLMHAAVALGELEGAGAIVLLGHATYYPRFGFRPAREQGLLPPADWPDAAWMALRLPASTPADVGVVHYAGPFMAMD